MSVTVILAASRTSAFADGSHKSLGLTASLREESAWLVSSQEEQLQPYVKCVQLDKATQERAGESASWTGLASLRETPEFLSQV